MFSRVTSCKLLGATVVIVFAGAAHGSIQVIADTSTTIPGTAQTFTGFAPNGVGYDGSAVSFLGGNANIAGAYAGLSSLSTLLDTTTTVPGSASTFGFFGGLAYRSGSFVLEGGASSTAQGIYARPAGGQLATVADTSTVEPGGSVTFTTFGNTPTVSSVGQVAFIGLSSKTSPSSGGIYSNLGGSLHAVADTNTTIPGGSTHFSSFVVPVMQGGATLYGGSSATEAALIEQLVGVAPSIIANQNTPIPSGTGNFTFFINPSMDASGNIAFHGGGTSDNGVYALIGGQLIRIAERNMTAPGGGTFGAIDPGSPAISGSDVVFEATRSVGITTLDGMYLSHDGTLSKIIETGDLLNGHAISTLGPLSSDSFSGSSVAFFASSNDGYQGIFLATVPEPATAAMLVVPALALMLGRKRQRRRGDV